ncbi:hypothetical protein MPSEU_000975800 [Mayamaea pseudoterrestris]|nr:hypothetical protein MPSEU_000975800 [Mayamaea pseudoterrestris]
MFSMKHALLVFTLAANTVSVTARRKNRPTASPTYIFKELIDGSAISTTSPTASSSDMPSDQPSLFVSDVPSILSSVASSDVPSVAPALAASDSPSNFMSELPSNVPSFGESWPTSLRGSDGLSDTPSLSPTMPVTADESDSPSDAPSLFPTAISDNPSQSPSLATSDASEQVPIGDLTRAPSDVPSLGFEQQGISDTPSDSPTFSLSSDTPSDSPTFTLSSDIPSDMPSDFPSDQPSMIQKSVTSEPTVLFSQQGYPETSGEPTAGPMQDISDSPSGVVNFVSSSNGIMDNETVAIFEDVIARQYLPQVLPLVYPASYTNTKCKVVSQTSLNSNAERKLQDTTTSKKQTAKLYVTTDDIKILLRISSNVNPPAENFDELVGTALQEYPNLLQQLLSNQTTYFETESSIDKSDRDDDSVPPPVAAIEKTPTSSSGKNGMPVIIIISAVAGGVVVALLAAFYLGQRDAYRPPPERQIAGDCSIAFSETQDDIYPFGRVAESGRGGIMIQTSFSSISGSNMPLSLSPDPYPLVTPVNLPMGDDEFPVSTLASPVKSSRNGKSPVVSPRSTGSVASLMSMASALSPKSRGSAASPKSRSAVSPRSMASGASTEATLEAPQSLQDIKRSIETHWNPSLSIAGDVNKQDQPSDGKFETISERTSEESSWEREGKAVSTDDESNGLNGLNFVESVAVDDGRIQQPPRTLTVDPSINDSPTAESRNMFNFWGASASKDSLSTRPSEASRVQCIDGPLDSLASFITNDEDSMHPFQPAVQIQQTQTSAMRPVVPLAIDTNNKHAAHTGLLLDDLVSTEKEWSVSTTPKSGNQEKYKKPPRQILQEERILTDGNSI